MRIFPILLLLFCGALLPLTTFSQTVKALEKAGDEAVQQKDYYAALVHFSEALSVEPGNTRLNYKYAEVARQFNAYQIAAEYYGKVNATPESAQYPLATFWLAMMEKSIGWYAEAEAHFGRFLTMKRTDPDDPFFIARAKKELAWCRQTLNGGAAPDPYILVEQLGKQINTDYSEFAPLERGDTLFYTSYRYDIKGDKHSPTRKMSKLLVSVHEQRGRPLSRSLNDELLSTAHVAFSSDGQRLYYTLCDYVSEAELRCKIYYRALDKYGKWSRKANALPTFINQDGYTATQPGLGFDSTRQKEILYYVSDRPGGQGKLDIWYSVIDGETFSKPENLESINTPENEVSPYFHTPSQTLYFSSDGLPGWGEFDVWKSVLDSTQWLAPELLPAPVNTGYDDLYYTVGVEEDRAWLASNRPGAFYLDPDNKACCNDLFRVTYLPKPDPQDTTVVTVPPPLPPPPDPVPAEPETLEDFLPLALYFDNDEPDKRTQRTTTRKTYTETFDRYYLRKEEYLDEYCKPLEGDDKILSEELMDTFFEEEVRKGRDYLYLFSEILLKRLEEGDQVEIFIKGYTSPRAKSEYNLSLGQRRVSSVRNHFQTYKEGVFRSYLSNGQLRITERSFGETLASQEVSDELEDVRNSVYSIGAAKERRVEIVEIQRSN